MSETSSVIILRDATRGDITQHIDAANPPSIGSVGRTIGGAWAQAGSQFFDNQGGTSVPISNDTIVVPGSVYTCTANIKAGR